MSLESHITKFSSAACISGGWPLEQAVGPRQPWVRPLWGWLRHLDILPSDNVGSSSAGRLGRCSAAPPLQRLLFRIRLPSSPSPYSPTNAGRRCRQGCASRHRRGCYCRTARGRRRIPTRGCRCWREALDAPSGRLLRGGDQRPLAPVGLGDFNAASVLPAPVGFGFCAADCPHRPLPLVTAIRQG